MSYSLRKRTHSSTKDVNTSPISTPRKKTKESSTTSTPRKITSIESNYKLRSKDKQEDSKKSVNYIGNKSLSKINNDGDEVNGELTRNTSSLSIEDNCNNIGSNASSPLSSPPSSPNLLENDAENDSDYKDDTIEPLLLPNVVWINDEKRGWWPSEIISKDKAEKPLLVRLFGREQPERPRILELHNISKSNILPFRDELFEQFRKTGENSNAKALFNEAIAEAIEKETEDNDGLPSKDFAFQMVVDSSPNNQKKKNGRKSSMNEKRAKGMNHPSAEKKSSNKEKHTNKQDLSDFDFGRDETLQIPGECVLALSLQKKYYPAKITGYSEPDKYKVLFCDHSIGIVKRKNFFTKYEDGFKTCEMGHFEMDFEDQTYENPELVKKIQSLEPTLSRILQGEEDSWRFQHFCKGGKKLKLLASKVSPGPFNLSQFGLIAKVLRGMFIPEVAESIDRKNKVKLAKAIDDEGKLIEIEAAKPSEDNKSSNVNDMTQQQPFFDFQTLSSDLKLRFVNDVLLPETIIRLVMIDEKIGYEEADRKILDGYNEARWVEHLMAERASFQIGSESLRERHE